MGNIHGVGGAARQSLILRAATTAVLLSLLFLMVYGGTNWLTAQRPATDVQTWYGTWELSLIPYVPLLIVPYMSIDVLFFLAAFVCRDERELRTFSRRVTFSILAAGAFFLLMPLKLAWLARPQVAGWFGDFVEQSCTAPFLMEYPHNLFPALHITLSMILADLYGRHARGTIRVLSYSWFVLIALSTVLTWQHHVIDIAGGVMLGGFAAYFFRESESHCSVTPNLRVGCYYGAGTVLVLIMAKALGLWGALLLWPTAALAIAAAGYFGLGPGIYRKTDGRLPLSTRFVLAPVLLGQYLSLVYYRRQCRAWDEIVPNVLIGRILSDAEAADVVEQGVTAVLDLTAEFAEATPLRATTYRNLPILDLTAPTQDQLREAATFVARESAHGVVYVHCKIGYSRSAAVVAAYLLATQQAATVEEAVASLRRARPSIVIRPEVLQALRTFAGDASPQSSPVQLSRRRNRHDQPRKRTPTPST
jgi:protein-tyrosine phosphatase/membrane-associated phospholipid phosphatase